MKVELQNISKYYGSVCANDNITLTVEPGTIHGILGENGAGKSTLMKILSGYCRKTNGTVILDGVPVTIESPAHSLEKGIGMLYQDPMDFPSLPVFDNFMLGKKSRIARSRKKDSKAFDDITSFFGFDLEADELVSKLTPGKRQQLELVRLMHLGMKTLILDEPTTGISAQQKEVLFNALKKLALEGKSVILVSHKLSDIKALCDKVSVLRGGRVTGDAEKPFSENKLLKMMFGDMPSSIPTHSVVEPGGELLSMENISAGGGRKGLRNCSVTIREGEVIGLAGLEGSGQGVFLRTAAGLTKSVKGAVGLGGKCMNKENYHAFSRAGVAFLPGNRLEEGSIPGLSIAEHFILKGTSATIPESKVFASKQIARFQIKGTPDTFVESLSGGNLQRLIISLLPEHPRLLLLENPTRGLDISSARRIWQELHSYNESGVSIVFSSPDLDEIVSESDRVLVFFNGCVVRDVKSEITDMNELGRNIAGIT
jgi:general nucleoside transport system ATP-binding protein